MEIASEVIGLTSSIFFLHLVACAFMTGLIWIVQLILYPAFAFVEPAKFKQFHALHSSRISLVVGPAMLLELATAVVLLFQADPVWLWQLNFIAVILIWISTVFISVPIHNGLVGGSDLHKIKKLVRTNWPRTILWTLRLIVLVLGFYFVEIH